MGRKLVCCNQNKTEDSMCNTLYVYINIYVYIYICMHMCIVGMYLHLCGCIYIWVCIYVYMHICEYVHGYVWVCMYVYEVYICICVWMCIHIYVCVYRCIYAWTYTFLYIMYTFVCMWSDRGQFDLKSSINFIHRSMFSNCSIPWGFLNYIHFFICGGQEYVWWLEDTRVASLLPPFVGPRDQTQVTRLSSKCIYALSYLANPFLGVFKVRSVQKCLHLVSPSVLGIMKMPNTPAYGEQGSSGHEPNERWSCLIRVKAPHNQKLYLGVAWWFGK